jgi:hypothetical protein
MASNPKICQGRRANGDPCKAHAINGSPFCFFHDPAAAAKRTAARKAGGQKHRAATLAPTSADFPLEAVQDVAKLLADTINHVRRGELDPRVANSVGYLAGILLRAIEQGATEERLAALEAVVSGPRQAEPLFNRDPFEPNITERLPA